ncbi:hypothetical protein HGRIS_009540 [Hohenbuehelia grisea]|uniref:Translocator protein n=1 Tax=Hohenbuehelia grisea TaxID=104357 RepID=A0ABR3J1H4_9AGAR
MPFATAFVGLALNPITAAGIPLALGMLSGSPTGNAVQSQWYKDLRTPPGRPPRQAFPIAWSLLYLSMGYASHIAARALNETISPSHHAQLEHGLNLYYVQLALNLAWSPLFFGAKKIGLALADSVLLTGTAWYMTALLHNPTNSQTTYFLAPYCAWLSFATYLNAGIWFMN